MKLTLKLKKQWWLCLLLLAGLNSVYSQVEVSGTVIDAGDNTPLIGVNVLLQGTDSGTVTDLDGNFRIPERRLIQKVVFRFIGYQTLEVLEEDVPKRKLWVVELEPGSETLE